MENLVRFRLLGPVQVTRDEESVQGFESRKALALLCYLAARRQPVSRGHLADLFWGDKLEVQGRANLSRVLHNNAALLPGCLQVSRDTIQFGPTSEYWVDVLAFDELVAQGDTASLTAAAALYRDDFMADTQLKYCSEFEIWLVTEREVWRQRLAQVLRRLITLHYHEGNYEQSLTFAERLLALDPWREEAHRHRMLLLALCGQRSAALAQYETCRRILAEELRVTPGTETTALYQRIRAGELINKPTIKPEANGPIAPAPSPNLPAQLPAPNGREDELAQIVDRLNNPACRLLTLMGPNVAGQACLALQAAADKLDAFSHGVYYIPLTAASSTDSFVSALADVFKLSVHGPEDLKVQLFNYLREKEMLLILGYFGSFVGGAKLLDDILKRAPKIKILVSAQEPLNLCLEWIFDIG